VRARRGRHAHAARARRRGGHRRLPARDPAARCARRLRGRGLRPATACACGG
jgi:hypothetical protein